VDPDMLSFFNINTPADLERARRLMSNGTVQDGDQTANHG
jgi:hypothetical protein